jgi:hypothetical protein
MPMLVAALRTGDQDLSLAGQNSSKMAPSVGLPNRRLPEWLMWREAGGARSQSPVDTADDTHEN